MKDIKQLKALWASVMWQAIHDTKLRELTNEERENWQPGKVRARDDAKTDAFIWVEADDTDTFNSFLSLCGLLNLSPVAMRRFILLDEPLRKIKEADNDEDTDIQ